jgi:hypothetical protein
LRSVATRFGVSRGAVAYWVARARGRRLDRVEFANRKPGRAANRTAARMEQRILRTRRALHEQSVLGEYGPDAISAALRESRTTQPPPSRTTIYRVLARHGALDGVHRQRRPAPPKGWYLPDLAAGEAELDSFDFIEELKIAGGPLVDVLTATSLHGALAQAWVMERSGARVTLRALLEHWRREGLPSYAQFDNDMIFQGTHRFADAVGRISRLCLALGVVPVFAPPREPGFQNAIEGFNALWQSKVWRRHRFPDVASLEAVSERYVAAYRAKTAMRRESSPKRRRFPRAFKLNLRAPLEGTMIFVRRSDDNGSVNLLGRTFPVAKYWAHRLVRCEVDFTHERIRFYALRRRDPDAQPLLRQIAYRRPSKPFQGQS